MLHFVKQDALTDVFNGDIRKFDGSLPVWCKVANISTLCYNTPNESEGILW